MQNPSATRSGFPAAITTFLTYELLFPNIFTYSKDQSPSWETNRFSVSQEIPLILWNPEGLLPLLQVPATCPYP